jgi:hypothetical protein
VVLLAGPARADDPVSSSVRFNREIIRIFQRKCMPCHDAGGIAMSLATYHAARDWGRAIREELVEQRMPPAAAAPGYGRFENDIGLTSREMTTILAWLDGGMARGDDSDLPLRAGPSAEASDGDPAHLRLAVPAQNVPANADLVIRTATIDTRLRSERLLTRVVVRPGERRLLRGALVFGPGHQWLGAWLPWQPVMTPPPSHAYTLPAGARLTLLLYYRGADQPLVDRPAVELHMAPESRRAIDDVVMEGVEDRTPGDADRTPKGVRYVVRHLKGQRLVERDTTIWALQPSYDASASSLELSARRPDGAVEVLLWIPVVRHEWPQALVLQRPITLPAGTVLSLTTRHDAVAPSTPAARISVSVLRGPREKPPAR